MIMNNILDLMINLYFNVYFRSTSVQLNMLDYVLYFCFCNFINSLCRIILLNWMIANIYKYLPCKLHFCARFLVKIYLLKQITMATVHWTCQYCKLLIMVSTQREFINCTNLDYYVFVFSIMNIKLEIYGARMHINEGSFQKWTKIYYYFKGKINII